MNLDTVERLTSIIFTILYLLTPIFNNCFTFFAFLDNFIFFDCADNGRPNFLPVALILSNEAFVRCDIKFRSISADNQNAKAITLL